MNEDLVILVDKNDVQQGTMPKLEAHQKGALHRAFSILVFNHKNEFLLQQRAIGKYHSEGLWTNTCCSHPKPGEDTIDAAHRRLREEMGFNCDLSHGFSFLYNSPLDNHLVEHEFDHVYFGKYDGSLAPDPKEVMNTRWISFGSLQDQLAVTPHHFTYWFRKIMADHTPSIENYLLNS